MGNLKKLKFYTALFSAKMTSSLLKLSRQSGTSLPGVVAFKLAPAFFENASEYCKNKIISVTGTNGKTTTSGILAAILQAGNFKVLHNQKGANMPQGIATAIATGLNPLKKADYFVLETDEAYLTKVYDGLKSDYLIVTNLFQDQLDRYGEIDATAKKIREAIDKNPNLTLLLNADDSKLKELYTNRVITYGFEDIVLVGNDTEIKFTDEYCSCGNKFDYTKTFYGHLGHYRCPCGYERPMCDVSATAKIFADKSELEVKYKGDKFSFVVHISGLYNAYNALAAIALALVENVSFDVIQSALDNYKSAFGRAQRVKINNKDVFIQLIKNSVGATEVIKTICKDKNSKLLIITNDEYSDGRDMSWLWDTDFESFSNYSGNIYTSGKRALDVALRLKYTDYDFNKIKIIPDIDSALNSALEELSTGQTLHIMPNYTALMSLQNILKNRI